MVSLPSLAVFDFDFTITDEDSDATIVTTLEEKKLPPDWKPGEDWIPYMRGVFEHAFTHGYHPSDILESIASMKPTPGMPQLLQTLAKEGWDVLVLSDANSVFITHWLQAHGLQNTVTDVITNRAFWMNDRLYLDQCMEQTSCPRCPTNLCKALALEQWTRARRYERVVYIGDGQNDYCPATSLPADSIVFPRKNYTLNNLIRKTLASPEPEVKCSVVPWSHADTILHTIFPALSTT